MSGLVRRPVVEEKTNKFLMYFRKSKKKITYIIKSEEGLFTNCLVVLVYIIIIFAIPLAIYAAFVWSLLQVNIIRADIYAPVFNMNDVFSSSSYNFWLDDLDEAWLFYLMGGLSLLFIVIGYAELI